MPKPNSTLPGHTASGYKRAEPPPVGTPAHEEWLIDVSIEQTFPASDPPSTMSTGNLLNESADKNKQ